MPRRITKVGEHSNPVIRSFIASFGVALIKNPPEVIDCFRRIFLMLYGLKCLASESRLSACFTEGMILVVAGYG